MGCVRNLFPVVLTTILVAALAVVAPVPARAAGWGTPVVSSASGRQVCADFLFIGVRGSGEPAGFGPTVTGIRDALKKRWKRDGTVRQVYLDYPAVAPQTLGEMPFENLLFDQPLKAKYFDSAGEGATALISVMDDSLRRCPREKVIVAGFSQGAQVITSALAATKPGSRLIAALLLGNPSHYPQQNVRELNGTASTNAIGLGAALTLLRKTGAEHSSRQLAVEAMIQHTFDITEGKANPVETAAAMKAAGAEISPEHYPRTYSVCLAGDLVCDAGEPLGRMLVGSTQLTDEMNRTRPIHLNYNETTLKQTLDAMYATAAAVDITTPAPGSTESPRTLPGRPTWFAAGGIGLAALVVGFVGGLVRGRALGRASILTALERRRQKELDDD